MIYFSMQVSRKLPIGIQDFEDLRQNGYLYVDKTAFVYRLATMGKPYFLSRPRRFGKSLLLSTIEAYFLGKKDLFEGLAIYEKEAEKPNPWQVYPVLKFSLASGEFTEPDGLRKTLDYALSGFEKKYGLKNDIESLPIRFANALTNATEKTGKKVVVLVDEYDNPHGTKDSSPIKLASLMMKLNTVFWKRSHPAILMSKKTHPHSTSTYLTMRLRKATLTEYENGSPLFLHCCRMPLEQKMTVSLSRIFRM